MAKPRKAKSKALPNSVAFVVIAVVALIAIGLLVWQFKKPPKLKGADIPEEKFWQHVREQAAKEGKQFGFTPATTKEERQQREAQFKAGTQSSQTTR